MVFNNLHLPYKSPSHVGICVMVKSRVLLGRVIPPFNRNPYNGYINPYYWVDDHPLLYGNNGSLDPGTYIHIPVPWIPWACKGDFPQGEATRNTIDR